MSAVVKSDDEFLPRDLARLALAEAPGPLENAVAWAAEWLEKNPDWRESHRKEMEVVWLRHAINGAICHERKVSNGLPTGGGRTSASNVIPMPANTVAAAIADNYSRMMDFPLWGSSKRIGDATVAEIRASAEGFGKQGRTLLRKERWQLAVADAAEKNSDNPEAPIRESLPERTLARLWEESDAS